MIIKKNYKKQCYKKNYWSLLGELRTQHVVHTAHFAYTVVNFLKKNIYLWLAHIVQLVLIGGQCWSTVMQFGLRRGIYCGLTAQGLIHFAHTNHFTT